MEEPSRETLERLLAMADTHSEIRRLRKRLDELPEQQQLDEARSELTALEQQREDRGLERDRVQAEASREDREVDQLRQRLAAEQQRLYGGEISNQKELQSMEAEIESVQRRIDEHEEAELEALEQVEALEHEMAELAEAAGTQHQLVVDREAARDEAAKALLAEIAELEATYEDQRAPLPADLLARYDASADRFGGGVAVGRLDQDQCTACGIRLSYADVNELIEGPPLATCPQCQRLMAVL